MESPSSILHYWFRSSATAIQSAWSRRERLRGRLPTGHGTPANPLALSDQIRTTLPPARRRTKCFSAGSSLQIEVTAWQSQRLVNKERNPWLRSRLASDYSRAVVSFATVLGRVAARWPFRRLDIVNASSLPHVTDTRNLPVFSSGRGGN